LHVGNPTDGEARRAASGLLGSGEVVGAAKEADASGVRAQIQPTGVEKLELSMMNVCGCIDLLSPPVPAGLKYTLINAMLG